MALTRRERAGACVIFLLALDERMRAPRRGPRPSDDATSRHDFADVPYWSSVFDDPARDTWQKPAELVAALGIRAGARVADLGAGTGYFSRRLANAVGPEGTVFAVETEPEPRCAPARARRRARRPPNVVPVLAFPSEPHLPPGRVDLILVVDTYHHLDARRTYLPRAAPLPTAGRTRRDRRLAQARPARGPAHGPQARARAGARRDAGERLHPRGRAHDPAVSVLPGVRSGERGESPGTPTR
jgi:SAM-dependent methyltransferase